MEPPPVPVIQASAKPVVEGISFGVLSKGYLQHMKASGRTAKHIVNVATLLKNCFFKVIDKNKPVDAMTYVDDIMPFIDHFQGISEQTRRPRSQTTINRYFDCLDAIINFGIENDLSKVNPMPSGRRVKRSPGRCF